jgi:predicted Zn-dependent protease
MRIAAGYSPTAAIAAGEDHAAQQHFVSIDPQRHDLERIQAQHGGGPRRVRHTLALM